MGFARRFCGEAPAIGAFGDSGVGRGAAPCGAAQFNSVWKSLNDEQQEALRKEAKAKKVKLSVKGLADAPATSNPGVVVPHGEIIREVTVNLVALRALRGASEEETRNIRRYLLALSLIAASAELDLYLREGCHLRFADDRDSWHSVPRRGEPTRLEMDSDVAKASLLDYGKAAVKPFKEGWPEQLSYKFDIKAAKALLAKKEEAENEPS